MVGGVRRTCKLRKYTAHARTHTHTYAHTHTWTDLWYISRRATAIVCHPLPWSHAGQGGPGQTEVGDIDANGKVRERLLFRRHKFSVLHENVRGLDVSVDKIGGVHLAKADEDLDENELGVGCRGGVLLQAWNENFEGTHVP